MSVTVVIPTLRERHQLLLDAVQSVENQTEQCKWITEYDLDGMQGAAITRNIGMTKVGTEWTAFLDDDDLLLPHHVEYLLDEAEEHNLDLCWGWYDVIGGHDPFPNHRGRQWDPENPHVFPITVLVRTQMLHDAYDYMGGFQSDDKVGSWLAQDLPIWYDIVTRQGGRHMAFSKVTWQWRHHLSNTSGLSKRYRK